ncbi:hypothetical protein GH733_005917 [Mirounga leonina]|nr:hypothetical protein GH733_005917 [Mirounga leonina]
MAIFYFWTLSTTLPSTRVYSFFSTWQNAVLTKMKRELGMTLSLQNVVEKTTTPRETKLLASQIYGILQSSNMVDGDSFNEMSSHRKKTQIFLGTTYKHPKTVVLHIDGTDDMSQRNLCEEDLVKNKVIESTQVMKAHQVVKSESGEEMLVLFPDTPVEVEQNTELSDYLPEDESPLRAGQSSVLD